MWPKKEPDSFSNNGMNAAAQLLAAGEKAEITTKEYNKTKDDVDKHG